MTMTHQSDNYTGNYSRFYWIKIITNRLRLFVQLSIESEIKTNTSYDTLENFAKLIE